MILTYLTAIGICYLFIHFIVPQLIESIMGFVNDIPQYVDNLTTIFNDLIKDTNISPEYVALMQEQMDNILNL